MPGNRLIGLILTWIKYLLFQKRLNKMLSLAR